MKATIKDGVLKLEARLSPNPPRSKSGKTLVPFTTSGFVPLVDEKGKEYSLSINLTTKN